jgi:hypothetical protein
VPGACDWAKRVRAAAALALRPTERHSPLGHGVSGLFIRRSHAVVAALKCLVRSLERAVCDVLVLAPASLLHLERPATDPSRRVGRGLQTPAIRSFAAVHGGRPGEETTGPAQAAQYRGITRGGVGRGDR